MKQDVVHSEESSSERQGDEDFDAVSDLESNRLLEIEA